MYQTIIQYNDIIAVVVNFQLSLSETKSRQSENLVNFKTKIFKKVTLRLGPNLSATTALKQMTSCQSRFKVNRKTQNSYWSYFQIFELSIYLRIYGTMF